MFLLAQLAVHQSFHGSGLGKVCLIQALEYLWAVHHHLRALVCGGGLLNGCGTGVYAKYGFEVLCVQNGRVRMYFTHENG